MSKSDRLGIGFAEFGGLMAEARKLLDACEDQAFGMVVSAVMEVMAEGRDIDDIDQQIEAAMRNAALLLAWSEMAGEKKQGG